MPMRCSFTLDLETMDLIDKYAKEHGIDRNRTILEFIENGYAHMNEGGDVNHNNQRMFEEYSELKTAIEDVRTTLNELKEEIRLIHHTIEVEWGKEERGVPYQSRRWWEFLWGQ